MKIVNLADVPEFIGQYVVLRNTYRERLCTAEVTGDDTVSWLVSSNICVEVAIDNDELVGAVVLYLDKDGELAIFTKYHGRGIASRLLHSIKSSAKKTYLLKHIWAWVADDNIASSSMFLKNGFYKATAVSKQYNNLTTFGCMFRHEF